MKTFQQFNEDLRKLQGELETLERQSAPARRLAARRRSALERTKQLHKAEKNRQKRYQEQQKERNEELQLEQSPHMDPTPFNIMKAQAQAKGGIAHRRHVHQEIGAEARRQETAHQRRLAKLNGTP